MNTSKASTSKSNNLGSVSRITAKIPASLGKEYSISASGLTKKTQANLVSGHLDVLTFNSIDEFVVILKGTTTAQALCASLPATGANSVPIFTKKYLNEHPDSNAIARCKEDLVFPNGQPGVLILDYDPPSKSISLDRDALWSLLCQLIPAIVNVGVAWWCSGSSHIYSGDTELQGLRGQRFYVLINDLQDTERCGEVLAKRLWLAGQGAISVSASGAKLVRSTFDETMSQQARFDFIGGAVCCAPLEQRRGVPVILATGGWLDTYVAVPNLSEQEQAKYESLVEVAKTKMENESRIARDTWVEKNSKNLSDKLVCSGIEREHAANRAEHCLKSALKGDLHGDFDIVLDDGEIVSVSHILDNKERFHGRLTRDPIEPEYLNGKIVGRLYLFGARPNLFSFARGGRNYALRRQPKRLYYLKGKRHELADSIIDVLSKEPDIFVQGRQLVQVVNGGVRTLQKSLIAYIVGSRIALFSQNGKGDDCPVDLPAEVSDTVLSLADRRAFNELRAFVSLPFIRTDGSVALNSGYDTKTKIYADFCGGEIAPIVNDLQRIDIVDALRTLWRPWCKFPFATDCDRGAMLAAIFTAICRPALELAPAFFFEAPVQGSGKSLCAETLGALIRGSRGGVSPYVGGEGAEVELSKKIVSLLMGGASFWMIDNVIGSWKSAVLSGMLTTGAISGRILGQSSEFEGVTRMFVCATGNNANLDKDLMRRFVRIRIDSQVETPQGRDFDFDPVARVLTERLKIARAVLIVMSAFVQAGKPVIGKGTAGFSDWSSMVRQSVLWCSREGFTIDAGIGECGDPAAHLLEVAGEQDEDTTSLHSLLRGLNSIFSKDTFQAKDLFKIWQHGLGVGTAHSKFKNESEALIFDGLLGILGNRRDITTQSISKLLNFRRDRCVGGFKLQRAGIDRNKVQEWFVLAHS